MNKNIKFDDVLHIVFWYFLAFLHPIFFAYYVPKIVRYSYFVGIKPFLWLIPLTIIILLSEMYCCDTAFKLPSKKREGVKQA